jgi:CRISPR-associated protein Cas2
MEVVVAYDVNTETREGERRLRKVATICLGFGQRVQKSGFGQRVQKSVFECRVSEAQMEEMEDRLLRTIDPTQDRLRIYRLPGDRERWIRMYGVEPPHDFRGTLVV